MPIGDDRVSRVALVRSKESNTAPRMMKSKAFSQQPPKAKAVAMQPQMRLLDVKAFGMCLVMQFAIYTLLYIRGERG